MYLENIELNKNDPDFQIEDFWYGFKNSMKNFYQQYNLNIRNIQEWSNILNEYKKDKKYDMIEFSIKNFIVYYTIDVMEHSDYNDAIHSNRLFKNMKRWKEISNKFHFDDDERYKIIYILFEGYNCVKTKVDNKLYPVLEIFRDLEEMLLNDYAELIFQSFKLGQFKLLENIEKIIGKKQVFNRIKNDFEDLKLEDKDCKTSYFKLHKKYEEKYHILEKYLFESS
jgi:hypothetical protein